MSQNALEIIPQDDLLQTEEVNFQEAVENAFSTGLGAAIMSEFPVASIMAIFRGQKGKKLVAEIDAITEQTGKSGGAKRLLAKIFSIYGFINGIVCTALYAFLGIYFTIYFTVLIPLMFVNMS